MQNKSYIFVAILLLSLTGCHKVKPQSPANQPVEDSSRVTAALINMQLAEAADAAITAWVQQTDTAFTEDEFGYWYCITRRSNGQQISDGNRVEIFFSTTTLQGQLIEDSQMELVVGRRETLWAIDNILPRMHEGESVIIASPFYTAYGRDGNDRVAPLTNCIIYISQVKIL